MPSSIVEYACCFRYLIAANSRQVPPFIDTIEEVPEVATKLESGSVVESQIAPTGVVPAKVLDMLF